MKEKIYSLIRIERSTVLKKISYEIKARSKKDAIRKLKKMKYELRDTIDEIYEDDWEPFNETIEIS